MTKLGRRGGNARARALKLRERRAIASTAARARWQPRRLVLGDPRDHEELQCFVAQYGNGRALAGPACDPRAILLRAIAACRDDACLAKMIPVFIWRARKEIFDSPLRPTSLSTSCALGYFLELTGRLGGSRVDLRALRRDRDRVEAPIVWFRFMDAPYLRELAAERTSSLAASWKLVLGEPDESFSTYFDRKIRHGQV